MDRLSNLPEQIRNHILYFLPTKDAIRISVLSSDWRYVSLSLPHLQFRHWSKRSESYNQNFRNGVYNLLSSREEVDLESLFLGVYMDYKYVTPSDLGNWVNTALKYRLQELCLDADYKDTIVLPNELFECETLNYLNFENFTLHFPSRIRFSNLKTLVLIGIHFPDQYKDIVFPDPNEDIVLMNKLFQRSSFPVLEDLEIRDCSQFHTLCISIPSLLYLKLVSYRFHKRVFVSIPSLRDFQYSGCPLEVCSKTLASLQSGVFEFPPNSDPNTDASDILSGLSNVEELWLKASFIESLSHDQPFFGKKPILAATLKQLCLEIYRTKKQTQVTSSLIKCFPKLQALYIDSLDTPEDMEAEEESVFAYNFDLEDVSNLPSLSIIEFSYFGGTEAELELAQYLLQRASNSTKVNISYKTDLSKPQINDIEKLLTLSTGSSHVTSI